MNKILVEVSVGELFDKISILEIKKDKIKDEEKLKYIIDEYNLLKEQMVDKVKLISFTLSTICSFNKLYSSIIYLSFSSSLILSFFISKIEILSKSSPTETSTRILFIKFFNMITC